MNSTHKVVYSYNFIEKALAHTHTKVPSKRDFAQSLHRISLQLTFPYSSIATRGSEILNNLSGYK